MPANLVHDSASFQFGVCYNRCILRNSEQSFTNGQPPRRLARLWCLHSVFKKVINASLSTGLNSLKPRAASCASPS
jgi:hypothetical protein